MALSSHANVYNTCLLILRGRGYELSVEGELDADQIIEPSSLHWIAEKDDFRFLADNPIELLGLSAIYEHKKPTSHESYWWSLDGPDIYVELMDKAFR